MDEETRQSLRMCIGAVIDNIPWKLLTGAEKGRDRAEQWRRREVVRERIIKALESYNISKRPQELFPGHGPSQPILPALRSKPPD